MDTPIFVGQNGSVCPFCGCVLAMQNIQIRKIKINEEGCSALSFTAICPCCAKISYTVSYLDFETGLNHEKTLIWHDDLQELKEEILNGKLSKRQKENIENSW